MKTGLKDRVALIAGASSGLGKAAAEAFAEEGASLALCARGMEKLEETARQIRETHGVRVEIRSVDVSNSQAVSRFVEEMANLFQRIDVCIPNAGGPPAKDFLETTDADWQSAFDTNLRGTVAFCRSVLPHMRERKWGRIVAITSMAVRQPLPQLVLSNTLRTGLLGLFRTLSNDFAQYGITINNVAPGYTATRRLKELSSKLAASSGKTVAEVEAVWIAGIPAGRLAQPKEVADAVVWLASERAAFITGQTLVVDGGMYKGV